ncbi:MAG: MarR family winged helix-turn-helix transcriptional regulator [Burkholderiaceae bacterium]
MDDTADVGERLHALMHRMKRRMHHAMSTDPDGLAPMAWRTLGYFARHPGHSASDLVENVGRDKAQVARLVRELTDRGLLAGTPAAHDQRRIELRLTPAGRQVERQAARRRRRIEAEMLAGFSATEQAQLAGYLERLHAALGDGAPP